MGNKKPEPRTHTAIVEAVHQAVPIVPRKVVALILEKYLEEIAQALVLGDGARMRGLGTLRPKDVAERLMRHPQTNAEILVPAKTKVAFRMARQLRTRLMPD